MAATTGRPAARIEYVFDGTLTAPEPGAQRHDVDVAGGEQLDEALVGHVAGEAHVGQAGGAPARASARAAPSPLIRNVTSGSRRAASTSSSSDCEKPTLPAYSTTGSSPMPSSRRYAVIRSAGPIASVSTKLGIVWTVAGPAGRHLGDDVGAQVVGQHRDGVGDAVAHPLQPRRDGDHAAVGDGAGLDGGVGEHVLDVEHERRPVAPTPRAGR